MYEQPSLPDSEAALQPTDRLFFAIMPTPRAAAAIARQTGLLREAHALKGRSIGIDRLHVTLIFLGNYLGLPQDVVAAAIAAAASIKAAPFDVAFDRAMSFRGRSHNRPLVLLGGDGVAALTAFQQALGRVLQNAGLGTANSHYIPHVTLLYDNRLVPAGTIEPISWVVSEFVLMHSLVDRVRHVPLARWSLGS